MTIFHVIKVTDTKRWRRLRRHQCRLASYRLVAHPPTAAIQLNVSLIIKKVKPKLKLHVCKQYLHYKENGYSINHAMKQSLRSYLLLIAYVAIIWFLPIFGDTFKLCITSAIIAVVIRDYGWFRKTEMLWPMTKEIIDWKKVEVLKKDCEIENQKQD